MPEGWAVAKLQDVGKWCSGGTPSRTKPEYFGNGIRWVKSGDLPDGPIIKTDEQITQLGLDNSAAKLMPPGTICMALYGATIGKLGTMTFDAATNQATANLVPDERLVDGQYVFHYLMSERQNFIDLGQGGAQPNISQEIVRKHPIKLAPLAEQRRIVGKLELLLGKVSSSQQRLSRVPGLLKRFRQSVLAAACSGKLTADWRDENDAAEEWTSTTLEAVGHVTGGITRNSKRDALPLKIPYLRVANVYANRLKLDDVKSIGVTPAEAVRTKLEAGDLLFVEGNGSLDQIGRVAIWDGSISNCVHQNHIIKFRANKGVEPRFLLLSMMSPLGRECLMEQAVSSAGLHSLSISKIAAIETEIPPLSEQQEIVRRVEKLFAFADQIEARLRQAQTHVDRITQSLLRKAFRGELVPTEHTLATAAGRDYEAASELVARIRAERDAASAIDKTKSIRVQENRRSRS